MLVAPGDQVLLQHRATWSHEGGTWALPGGARSSSESPLETALREAAEEAGVDPTAVRAAHSWIEDHGTWSYTTVVGHADGPVHAWAADRESLELRWVGFDEVSAHPLHPAFADAWPALREQGTRRLVLVVDAANVVGSRPDGWWRDRAGANARLRDGLAALTVRGVPAHALDLPADLWWPHIRLVVEGKAKAVGPVPGVDVRAADTDGDTVIAETASAALRGRPQDHVLAVTADRALRATLEGDGVRVLGPASLTRLL